MAHPFLQRKSSQVVLLVVSVAFAAFCVHGFIDMVRQTHTRAVARDWSAAINESQKLPPGLGRAEDLLARLKRIDTGYAPDEFKHAIADYISALQGAFDASKGGRDTTQFDKAMAEARERMVAIAGKYD
jgi:hypothetical protein